MVLLRERRDQCLALTLNRPEVGNAFDPALIGALAQGIREAAEDDGVRVVLLAGAGRHFSAGADLDYMRRMGSANAETNEADALETQRVFAAVADCPKPVVARVHGAARGGGVGLLAAADVTVASPAASFAFTEVRLGIIPAMIAPFVVERVGAARARRLFLTGETFGAAEAASWGLVDVATGEDDLDAVTTKIVSRLCAGAPGAQAEIKTLVREVAHRASAEVAEFTARRIARLRVADEGQEGMAAFLEKRPPRWRR